jgi:hypothetical protein
MPAMVLLHNIVEIFYLPNNDFLLIFLFLDLVKAIGRSLVGTTPRKTTARRVIPLAAARLFTGSLYRDTLSYDTECLKTEHS